MNTYGAMFTGSLAIASLSLVWGWALSSSEPRKEFHDIFDFTKNAELPNQELLTRVGIATFFTLLIIGGFTLL